MAYFNRSDWLILGHAKAKVAKSPALGPRAVLDLDPEAPGFVPQASPYHSPDEPKIDLFPQTRRQTGQQLLNFQQHHFPKNFVPRNSLIQPRNTLNQPSIQEDAEQGRLLNTFEQNVSYPEPNPHVFDPNNGHLHHLQNFQHLLGPPVSTFLEGNPYMVAQEGHDPESHKFGKESRTARWREKKAFEMSQRQQIHTTSQFPTHGALLFENGGISGHIMESHEPAEPTSSSMDESEWKFDSNLPRYPAPSFCREDGTWANTSEIHDDGYDRATYELQHRVGLNRQHSRSPKAPVKPIACLLHEEIREQWFSVCRPTVRLNESMSGFARRVAEMKEMSEEDLELLMGDRQPGMKVKEMALVYQGVRFE